MSKKRSFELITDPKKSAKKAGLIYIDHQGKGFRRVKRGKIFEYLDLKDKTIKNKKTLQRIHSLVLPPAWKEVWISPLANGHLQATGRDVRGRKQYKYHPEWRAFRDQTKYDRMLAFGKALPKIRARVKKDLALKGMPREKILATVVEVMQKTLIRIGNEEYAHKNHSYGLTTFRGKHVDIHGAEVTFHFKGKSGVKHNIELRDRRLAKIIQKCHDLPGHELFEYKDKKGNVHSIGSTQVNQYLKEISGEDFTAKDFRTWYGTVLAAEALAAFEEFDSQAQAKKNVLKAIESVAKKLGNTKAICKKCYIHPAIMDSYIDKTLLKNLKVEMKSIVSKPSSHLDPLEAAVIAFLYQKMEGK